MIIDADYRFDSCRGFLVLEGVNGAGKSTLLKKIASYLSAQDHLVFETLQPGGTPLGEKIRTIVLGEQKRELLSELFLFAADRAEHVSAVLVPALDQGQIVLCDRYYYSTIAFQGYGRGLPLKQVKQVNQIAIQDLLPDLVILLDLDPEEGLKRTRARTNSDVDSFESEELCFHEKIRKGFLEVADQCAEPVAVIDAQCTEDQVWTKVAPFIDSWLLGVKK